MSSTTISRRSPKRWRKGQIISVQMQNFMCHPDFSITFRPSLNIVVGANGVGKSSIVEALKLALGDNTKGVKDTTKAPPATVSRIRKGCNDACVEVAVAVDDEGNARKFRRTLSVRGDTVYSKFYFSAPGQGFHAATASQYKDELVRLGAISGESMMQILSQHDVSKFIDSTPQNKLMNLEEVIQVPMSADRLTGSAHDKSHSTAADAGPANNSSVLQRPSSKSPAAATALITEPLINVRANASVACDAFVENNQKIIADETKKAKLMQEITNIRQQLDLLQNCHDKNRIDVLERQIEFLKYKGAHERHTAESEKKNSCVKLIESIAANAAIREGIEEQRKNLCETYKKMFIALEKHSRKVGPELGNFNLRGPSSAIQIQFDNLNDSRVSIEAVRDAIREIDRHITDIDTPFDEAAERQKYEEMRRTYAEKRRELQELGGFSNVVTRRQNNDIRAADIRRRALNERTKTFEARLEQQQVIYRKAVGLLVSFKAHVEKMRRDGKLRGQCVGPLFANLFAVPSRDDAAGASNAGPSEQVMRTCEALIPHKDMRTFVFEHYEDLKAAQDSFTGRVNVMVAPEQQYALVSEEIKADFHRLSHQTFPGGQQPNVVWMEDFISTENDFVKNTVFYVSRMHQVPVIRIRSPPSPQLFDAIKVVMLKHLSRGLNRFVISNGTKQARDAGEDLKLYSLKQSDFNRQVVSDAQSLIGPTNLLKYFFDCPPTIAENDLKFSDENRKVEQEKIEIAQLEAKVKQLTNEIPQINAKLKDIEQRLQGRVSNRTRLEMLRSERQEKSEQLEEKLAELAAIDAPHLQTLQAALRAHAADVRRSCKGMVAQVQKLIYGVPVRPQPASDTDNNDSAVSADVDETINSDAGIGDAESATARSMFLRLLRHAQRHFEYTIELKKTPLQSETQLRDEIRMWDKKMGSSRADAAKAIKTLYNFLADSRRSRVQEDDGFATADNDSQLSSTSQLPTTGGANDAPSPPSSQRSASGTRRKRIAELDEAALNATDVDKMLGLLPAEQYGEFQEHRAQYESILNCDLYDALKELENLRKAQKDAKKIEELSTKLTKADQKNKVLARELSDAANEKVVQEKIFRSEIRRWLIGIESHISSLSSEFNKLLKTADKKFKGRVELKLQPRAVGAGPKSTATVAERGGVNDDSFDPKTAGLDVLVSFKAHAEVRSIHECPFSGGERSLTTMFLIMALQMLGDAGAPYRIVDEINQGMDPVNETAVMRSLISRAGDAVTATQYIVITPNLLENVLAELGENDKTTTVHMLAPFFMVEKPKARAARDAEALEDDEVGTKDSSRKRKKRPLPDDGESSDLQHPVKARLRRVAIEEAEKMYFLNLDQHTESIARLCKSIKFEGMDEHWRSGGNYDTA